MRRILFVPMVLWMAACDGPDECKGLVDSLYYQDLDGDGYGDPDQTTEYCKPPEGFVDNALDCDDSQRSVFTGADEICDGLDNDCDRAIDEGLPWQDFWADLDGDGFGDANNRTKSCDQPPNYVAVVGDCDDTSGAVNPDAVEVCDTIDNDCNGKVDDADANLDLDSATEWFEDDDQDGYGDPYSTFLSCLRPQPGGKPAADNSDDCDDTDPIINPTNTETCNGIDDDCDQLVDETDPDLDPAEVVTWYADVDGDGLGDPNVTIDACFQPWFYVDNADDCDDSNPFHADAATTTWKLDGDGDGVGAGEESTPACAAPSPDHVLAAYGEDCDDANPDINPLLPELCNGFDDNCDGLLDDEDPDVDLTGRPEIYADRDGDGFGNEDDILVVCEEGPGATTVDGDCDDANPDANPGEIEVCSGFDSDCNGYADADDPFFDPGNLPTWYEDADGDGYGARGSGDVTCEPPVGWVLNDDDCDDSSPTVTNGVWVNDNDSDGFGAGAQVGGLQCTQPQPGTVMLSVGEDCNDRDDTIYPGAPEICEDGIDQSCSGDDKTCFGLSCKELFDSGDTTDGVYELDPTGTGNEIVDVYCDMTTDGGGWTLVASSIGTFDDAAATYSSQLTTLEPTGSMSGVWSALRDQIPGNSDIRFACSRTPGTMTVDLSFYDNDWYREITNGNDAASCFNENNGVGQNGIPARKDNISGAEIAAGVQWGAGYIESEDSCSDTSDFTVDFNDRGMDSNQSDGTDWGEDDGTQKCGQSGVSGAWYIFVR